MIAALAALVFVGCNKEKPEETPKALAAELTVTGIENNCATISVTVTQGEASKALLVEAVRSEELTIDPTNDIQLITYIEQNGVEVTLPYTNTLSDVSVGKKMFTAVAVYNKEGRAEICKYVEWDPQGEVDGWSSQNNPGSLGEIKW